METKEKTEIVQVKKWKLIYLNLCFTTKADWCL